ncbi:MAG: hypothetical protein JNL21_25040 [Myxococcales bacterium]|nr:hypothetical protein [Myxococcales bacterium]
MKPAHVIFASALCSSMFLFACGDGGGGSPSGTPSGAKPAGSAAGGASAKASAKPSAAAPATASAAASAGGDAAPATSGSAPPADSAAANAEGGSPLPADLAKLVGDLKDVEELKDPKLDGFFFSGPKGSKLESAPAPGAWSTITADGAKLSFLAHSESDGGDGCPKMADMKAKAKGAKDLLSQNGKLKPWGKKSLGDEVDFWMFEKDGKVGFYGVKVFAGTDKTTYCCAPGEQADAEAMKPVVDKAKADVLAGVCLSLVKKF